MAHLTSLRTSKWTTSGIDYDYEITFKNYFDSRLLSETLKDFFLILNMFNTIS